MENILRKGKAKVSLKNENGFTLSKDYGFTIEEENGNFLAFDLAEHPEMGTTLLFGSQVFGLSFWTDAQLDKGLQTFSEAIKREQDRRSGRAY